MAKEETSLNLPIVLTGCLVGLLVGLTGVGGASLLTPFLLLIGVPAPTAVGTDLIYNTFTKLVGALQYWRQKAVGPRWVIALAAGGIPAAAGGGILTGLFRHRIGEDSFVRHSIGLVLVLAALFTLFQVFSPASAPRSVTETRSRRPLKLRYLVPLGALIGLLVGITSIGAGSLVAPVLLAWSKLKPRQIVGTDITNALFLSAAAGLTHAVFGTVNYHLALNLILGSIPGVLLGNRLTLYIPEKPLRTVMSGLVLLAGFSLI